MKFFGLLFIITFSLSCSRLYFGSFNQEYFDEVNQADILGETVSNWEDGARTDDSKNQFEWWYFDAELED